MASESKITVLVALAANLLIAVAKLVGGLVSGSSSMLAEAAHSVADTINQVFLLTSLKVAARPADPVHPFGYGKARFFWSLLAAVGIFVAGAIFSVYEGVHTLIHGSEGGSILVPYIVLGVAFVAEGSSWLRAVAQVRREAAAAGRPGAAIRTGEQGPDTQDRALGGHGSRDRPAAGGRRHRHAQAHR
jgi:cation diffusion facilitator family transporter